MSRRRKVPTPRRTGTGPDIYYKIGGETGKTAAFRRANMREKALRVTTRGFFHKIKLAGNSFYGACACAGTAVNTDVSVDFALAFSISGNCAQGAGFFANAAADAQILVDGMSHNDTST